MLNITKVSVSYPPAMIEWGLITQRVQSENVAVVCLRDPLVGKKNSISRADDSIESDPWQALRVLSSKTKVKRKDETSKPTSDSIKLINLWFSYLCYILGESLSDFDFPGQADKAIADETKNEWARTAFGFSESIYIFCHLQFKI